MTHIKFIEVNLIFFEFRGQRSGTTKADNAAKDKLTVEWFGEVNPFCKRLETQIFEDSGDSVSPFKHFDDINRFLALLLLGFASGLEGK